MQKPVILFTCIVNKGGMSRISKILLEVKKYLDFKLLIFSPSEINYEDTFWIKWSDEENVLNDNKINYYSERVKEFLKTHQLVPYCVVGDIFTLPYFDHLKCKKIFDAHILSIPMYSQIQKDKKRIYSFDQYLKEPFTLSLLRYKLKFIKFELGLMFKADAFISYSQATTRHLKKYYYSAVKGKKIHQIHLSALYVKPGKPETLSETKTPFSAYAFTRYHPQKGLAFLLTKNWKNVPLTVRGIKRTVFKNSFLKELLLLNINIHEWTKSDKKLRGELLSHGCILFPSIYEPWGLALSEALRLGCLCICHQNSSGHLEQITNLENGYLLDMRDEDIVMKVEAILKDKEKHYMIRKNAIAKQVERDSLCVESYRTLIEKLSME